jgi:hypothetical protein
VSAPGRAGALRPLDDAECRRLLGTATVGRISFTEGALPAIAPVPFALHDEQVLIPARRDSPMVRAVTGAVVAFGVDSFDPRTETGWSVTVVGPSRLLGDPGALGAALSGASLPGPWTSPDRCLITVQVGLLRGWRAEQQTDGEPHRTPQPSAPRDTVRSSAQGVPGVDTEGNERARPAR